jgi:membrane protease subunit HflC
VRQSEVVVVSTFLKPTDTKTNSGLYVKWPWPIQSINRFDQRVQIFEDKYSENYTANGDMVMTCVYVGWRISDAQIFFPKFSGGSVLAAQKQLENMIRSAKAAAIGGHTLSDLVNSNPSEIKFGDIEKEIQAGVEAELAKNQYGITIEFLGIKKLGLPENVTAAVFERMKSERQKYISEAQFQGEKEASNIKSAANRRAAEVLANAQSAATRIEGEGVAEAAKTLSVFQQNPELAIFQLKLETLKSSMNQKTTLFFDETKPPFDLFRTLPGNPPSK